MKRPYKEDLDYILQRIAPLGGELRSRRLLITGGTGFFGKWLIEGVIHANREFEFGTTLAILSRSPEKFLAEHPYFSEYPELSFIRGDIRNFEYPQGKFDYVIHAATEASVKLERENPEEMYSVIMDGTRRMLDFAVASDVKKLLFISSGAVYGTQPPELENIPEDFTENRDIRPNTAYGRGKLQAEQLCREYSATRGFEYVSARCFAFVGPYLPLDTHFAVGNFILDCLEKRPIVINGNGAPMRSYMYAADLAVWLWTILVNGQNGRPYNVGSDQAISIANLAKEVNLCFGNRNEIRILNPEENTLLPPRYVPDVSRSINELNLEINFGLRQSLEKTVRWHLQRNHP